jgi:hypothetical protein
LPSFAATRRRLRESGEPKQDGRTRRLRPEGDGHDRAACRAVTPHRRRRGLGAGLLLARPTDAPIAITINPEARVSVALAGALPPPGPCGKPADLAVAITNQGFVTSQLEAAFVGDAPPAPRPSTFTLRH